LAKSENRRWKEAAHTLVQAASRWMFLPMNPVFLLRTGKTEWQLLKCH
jgi:hypothetical protein